VGKAGLNGAKKDRDSMGDSTGDPKSVGVGGGVGLGVGTGVGIGIGLGVGGTTAPPSPVGGIGVGRGVVRGLAVGEQGFLEYVGFPQLFHHFDQSFH
jgi:hypothetical protein